MDLLWEDHPELLRCLGGDVVATSRNRGANRLCRVGRAGEEARSSCTAAMWGQALPLGS